LDRRSSEEKIMIKNIVLAGVLALAGSTAARAGDFNVSIDGRCNTFVLHVDGVFVAGRRGGCGTKVIGAGTIATVEGKDGMVYSDHGNGMALTWYFAKPTDGAGNVYLYGSDGMTDTLLKTGTYTESAISGPPAKHSGPDITAVSRN
jgi:hypothetical protein